MLDAYWASKILVGTWRSGDPAAVTAFHSVRMIWLLSRSVCGNCPAVLHLWGLAVCRCVHAGKRREPETRDANGCCDSPLFLFCWCVTGKRRKKSRTASSGAFLSASCCSTAVSSLWLLIFLLYCLMLPALSVILMLDAGRFEQRHTLSIPAHLHLPELEFFRLFHWCSHDLGQGQGHGIPHTGLCFHVLTEAPDCEWGVYGLHSCSSAHWCEKWPLFWASTSCGICFLPGKKRSGRQWWFHSTQAQCLPVSALVTVGCGWTSLCLMPREDLRVHR